MEALLNIKELPTSEASYVTLNYTERMQFNILIRLVAQLEQRKIIHTNIMNYLFSIQTSNDKSDAVYIRDLKEQLGLIDQEPLYNSVLKSMFMLRNTLATRILLMDVIKSTHAEDPKDTFWVEHDAVRQQLYSCYIAADCLYTALDAYCTDTVHNHDAATWLPALAYGGAGLLYMATPVIYFSGLFTAGFGVSAIDTALMSVTALLVAQSTFTLIAATALTVGATFLVIGCASYCGKMLEAHWNQKSYDKFANAAKTELDNKSNALKDIKVDNQGLHHYSLFTEKTASYIDKVSDDTSEKLKLDGVDVGNITII